MNRHPNTIRRSQLITTYGPGALVDWPHGAVIIGGLDNWRPGETITDARLLQAVEQRMARAFKGAPRSLQLCAPDAHEEDDRQAGAVAYPFPDWMLTRETFRWLGGGSARALVPASSHEVKRRDDKPAVLEHLELPDNIAEGMPRTAEKKLKSLELVPIRFIAACPAGHIQDINWRAVAHKGGTCSRQLWLVERGTAGELRGAAVTCDCGASVLLTTLMTDAKADKSPLGPCEGRQPWLGTDSGHWHKEDCKGPNGKPHPLRMLVRHASNVYFSSVMRALSLPERSDALSRAFDTFWDNVLRTLDDGLYETMLGTPLGLAFKTAGGTIDDLRAMAAERRGAEQGTANKALTDAELELFVRVEGRVGDDSPSSVFTAERFHFDKKGRAIDKIARVVLVHRLREVQALVGFTRLDTTSALPDEEVDLPLRVAPIARDLTWVPASENRGEGIFILLDPAAVKAWMHRASVGESAVRWAGALHKVLKRDGISADDLMYEFAGRTLIHTLSHALIQQIALDSGYAAASIRERIYARPGDAHFGVLLYTSSPDAEGTLGGLVALGRSLDTILERALEQARLCSHDPVCSSHHPDAASESATGAACHACMFVSESSCVMRNQLLDRAFLVPTVVNEDLAFFT